MSKTFEYDQTIQFYRNAIRKRINNMKSMCIDAENLGIQTLVGLADQGENLEDITSNLKLIDQTLDTTGKLIKIRKGFRQRFVDLFCIKIPQKIHVNKSLTLNQNEKWKSTPTRKKTIRIENSPRIYRSNDSLKLDSTDDELFDINQTIFRLRILAQDMNIQLNSQDKTIEMITKNLGRTENKIECQNKDLGKINYSKI